MFVDIVDAEAPRDRDRALAARRSRRASSRPRRQLPRRPSRSPRCSTQGRRPRRRRPAHRSCGGPARRAADHPPGRLRGPRRRRSAARPGAARRRGDAPELDEDEWWAADLEGCAVRDGDARSASSRGCSRCRPARSWRSRAQGDAPDLLVPLIRDAVRAVDVDGREIEVDLRVPRRGLMQIDVFTLFPEAFDWFASQRHVANALALGHELRLRQLPRPHAAQRRSGRRHAVRRRSGHGAARRRRRGGAAGALRHDPVELPARGA